MIEKDSPSVATLDQMFQVQDGWSNDEFYQTQYRVLQSRTLAKRTLDEMRLGNGPLGNVPVPKASMDPISIVKRGFAMVSAMVTGRPVAQPVSTEPHDADECGAVRSHRCLQGGHRHRTDSEQPPGRHPLHVGGSGVCRKGRGRGRQGVHRAEPRAAVQRVERSRRLVVATVDRTAQGG